MRLHFGKNCTFCRTRLRPAPRSRVLAALDALFALRWLQCPHCFDTLMQLRLPGPHVVVFWLAAYVSLYLASSDPVEIAAYQFPHVRASVVRQTVFAPLIAVDARVHAWNDEQALALPGWRLPESEVPPGDRVRAAISTASREPDSPR